MGQIDRSEGQRTFGRDPETYDKARPGYPEQVFEILQQRCGLGPGCKTFEIGPGTGTATRKLLELGASPLVAIEPDARLGNFLIETVRPGASALEVRVSPFEDVNLPQAGFDLGTCASAFHWIDESTSLQKIAGLLRDGGWWAVWWNLFFDGSRTDEFHQATNHLFATLDRGPSQSLSGSLPSFALNKDERLARLHSTSAFEDIGVEIFSIMIPVTTERLRRLYSTFSPISRLTPERREELLGRVAEVAEKQFGGNVELSVTTPMYTARRRVR